ncbi:hypothetical protein H696_06126 [Fonticula alba]|uniref:C3H1-type domain-containing protein n=1 Tax=Fonticula alba TaxID=691883 RepID=A0A058Z0I9_FONAL|nr:hypothetical protein H696_06126 [Fonticula alba]KCV67433.1 hypothetical protein H696_06126 [Fonticula alba]|eukprot:XP_009498160.1 hypothetical protein H696_06126 [Fonticula alba]
MAALVFLFSSAERRAAPPGPGPGALPAGPERAGGSPVFGRGDFGRAGPACALAQQLANGLATRHIGPTSTRPLNRALAVGPAEDLVSVGRADDTPGRGRPSSGPTARKQRQQASITFEVGVPHVSEEAISADKAIFYTGSVCPDYVSLEGCSLGDKCGLQHPALASATAQLVLEYPGDLGSASQAFERGPVLADWLGGLVDRLEQLDDLFGRCADYAPPAGPVDPEPGSGPGAATSAEDFPSLPRTAAPAAGQTSLAAEMQLAFDSRRLLHTQPTPDAVHVRRPGAPAAGTTGPATAASPAPGAEAEAEAEAGLGSAQAPRREEAPPARDSHALRAPRAIRASYAALRPVGDLYHRQRRQAFALLEEHKRLVAEEGSAHALALQTLRRELAAAHWAAARAIFRERNRSLDPLAVRAGDLDGLVDFMGLHPGEAIHFLDALLEGAAREARRLGRPLVVHLVTGLAGNAPASDARGKAQQAVASHLTQRGILFKDNAVFGCPGLLSAEVRPGAK